MAINVVSFLCLLSSLAPPIMAFQRAVPAIQEIVPRATYIGGWPLALDGTGGGCPEVAPVQCGNKGSSLNDECCPSGQSCIATELITAYCCPTDSDCKTSVTNFPVCSNSTWNMFKLNFGFFCCEPGTIAAIPVSGYGGLCVPSDQAVPQSQLAASASQVGAVATSVEPSSATSPPLSQSSSKQTSLTGTSSGGSSVPTTTPASGTASSSTSTGVPAGSDSTPNSSTDKSTKTSPVLSPGAIAGIVIGGLAIVLLAGIFWAMLRRRRPQPQPEIQYMPAPASASELPPTVGRKPVAHTMATSMYSSAPPAGQSPGGFSQPPQYGSEATERYDPPISPPPGRNAYNSGSSPYSQYAEMEGPGGVQVAELGADHTGH